MLLFDKIRNMKFSVEVKDISFSYTSGTLLTLDNINANILENKYVAIIGHNGSGKSTLSRIISGILKPLIGEVYIKNILISEKNLKFIRKQIGVVFQNPDSQFIGTTVYDDIEFGLQNYQVKPSKMENIIIESAKYVKIDHLLDSEPCDLSGGQKQKAAIASIFALKPNVVIFDESTSMLDPKGKREIKSLMNILSTKFNKTVISITHDMEEAVNVDHIFVMNKGTIIANGSPKEIFMKNSLKLSQIGLNQPSSLIISKKLNKKNKNLKETISEEALIKNLNKLISLRKPKAYKNNCNRFKFIKNKEKLTTAICARELNVIYSKGFPTQKKALSNFSIDIYKSKINTIIGNTGSGKSTFIKTINKLLNVDSGELEINLKNEKYKVINNIIKKNGRRVSVKKVRRSVGMVFQFPEYQLFNSTIEKEIIFGPVNFGYKKKKIKKNVPEILKKVGLDPKLSMRNPFDLSGGQKRRVAIASVLSYDPEILIFDEPTAGLDPIGSEMILKIISDLKKEGKTIILITHNMDHVLQLSDKITIMRDGKNVFHGDSNVIFNDEKLVIENSLEIPYIYRILNELKLDTKELNIQNIDELILFLSELI